MTKLPEPQVLIPYKTLCELLEVAQEVPKLRREFDRLYKQQNALRVEFLQLKEAFGDLRRYVSD